VSRTITAKDIGPVPQVVIELPERGGVVELLGHNGAGKSQLLAATERMLGVGKSQITNRDNTLRGSLEGLGIKLSVSRGGTRRTGELEVVSLEHRLDLATFIDPQIDSPDAADRRRIAALMALSGVTADSTRFHRLVGGAEKFAALVDAKVEKMTDIVEVAKQVKMDLERHARQLESQADRELGEAKGAQGVTDGLDMDAETDPVKLDAARDAAVAAHSALVTSRDSAQATKDSASLAQRQLKAASEQQGTSVSEATVLLTTAQENATAAEKDVAKISDEVLEIRKQLDAAARRLDTATHRRDEANADVKRAEERLTDAQKHETTLQSWRQTIAAAVDVKMPSEADIAAAQEAVEKAKAAVETGTLVRAARRAKAQADKHLAKADEFNRDAVAMRDAAKQTDEVLSELVNAPGLSVDGGRLIAKHPRRGQTFFSELSMGERTRTAMGLGAARVGKGGLLVLPQEFWESLDPTHRREVSKIAIDLEVTVITARAADGEIRSQVYEPTDGNP
jgi:energy-coupling factor transporter ATP-binding protein EcfA2